MRLQIEIEGVLRRLTVKPVPDGMPGRFRVEMEQAMPVNGAGESTTAEACLLRPGVVSVIVNGRSYRCVLDEQAGETAVLLERTRLPYTLNDPRSLRARRARSGGEDGPRTVKAPMPGRVVRVLAAQGEAVEAQQGLVVIEAMKMQNELKSPKAGSVTELRVTPGDTVAAGDVLAVVQ